MDLNLQDAATFEQHFVKPMVDGVRAEISPLVARVVALEAKAAATEKVLIELKANQAKALVGWTLFVTGITLFLDQIRAWIWTKVKGYV